MTEKTTHVMSAGRTIRANTDSLLFDSLPFMSLCPKCKDVRSQLGYSLRALLRLLNGNHPVEAYCVICNEYWPISPQERVRLGEHLCG
jgi:hypothetical protein